MQELLFGINLADYMHNLGFLPCPSYLVLCMKQMVRPEDGFEYYAYFLIYVDNLMVIHHYAESVIWRMDKYFKLKPSSTSDPDIYLGAKLKKMRLENELWSW